MSHKLTQAVMELDPTPHEHEEAMMSMMPAGEVGSAVADARAAGISWQNIIALMVQFGPQFMMMIQAILAALQTAPVVPAETVSTIPDGSPKKRKHKHESE